MSTENDLGTVRRGYIVLKDRADHSCWSNTVPLPGKYKDVPEGSVAYLDSEGMVRIRE